MFSEKLQFAMDIARGAGKILRDNYGKVREINFKGDIDLVTNVDLQSEEYIIKRIKEKYPRDEILAEESGDIQGSGGLWIIDPLDGTTNFTHNYPKFAVSIGYVENSLIKFGVVYDPMLDEMFYGEENMGAYLNGVKLKVSEVGNLIIALLATGFTYDVRETGRNIAEFNNFLVEVQGIRRDGSAALDLAYLAAGRFDGFWEYGLKPWDVVAGILLVREAGGEVTNMRGEEYKIGSYEILASNGKIHRDMIETIKKARENDYEQK